MNRNLLTNPPDWFDNQFRMICQTEGETPVGFFAETKPIGNGRVTPEYWVGVTNRSLYYFNLSGLCVRARVLHSLDPAPAPATVPTPEHVLECDDCGFIARTIDEANEHATHATSPTDESDDHDDRGSWGLLDLSKADQ